MSLFRSTLTKKYKTTNRLLFGNSMDFVLDKKEYNPKTKTMKIAYALENESLGDTSAATSDSISADSLAILSNTKFKSNLVSIVNPGQKIKHATIRLKDDYLVITAKNVEPGFKLLKIQLASNVINSNFDKTEVKDDTVFNLYIKEDSFNKTNKRVALDRSSLKRDYLANKGGNVEKEIVKVQKENEALKRDNKQKQVLIDSYNQTIKQNKSSIARNNESISSLKKQVKFYEK